jgi:FixJ family two-component response regulator
MRGMFEPSPIAIIDDDALVRSSMARLVRSFGLAAQTFASAQEYLRISEAGSFACVISDVQMPTLNGLQLQQILVTNGSATPIIIMTAFPDDDIRAQALAGGAICFLEKPVDGSTLIACLESAIGKFNV